MESLYVGLIGAVGGVILGFLVGCLGIPFLPEKISFEKAFDAVCDSTFHRCRDDAILADAMSHGEIVLQNARSLLIYKSSSTEELVRITVKDLRGWIIFDCMDGHCSWLISKCRRLSRAEECLAEAMMERIRRVPCLHSSSVGGMKKA